MVEFIKLFIGLVTGLQTLEVSVTEDVARVELRLDGVTLATLVWLSADNAKPERVAVSFGNELL